MDVKSAGRWIALGVLFLVPFTPLVVANSFFFPFITGKAFFFRILVEIAFGAWVLLALADKQYRPRYSWIGVAVLAFVVWMFVADLAALNATKAFWSNFERMEGWVWIAHLAGFFFVASNVLRVEERWRAWFLTSLGVSVIVSVHALLQLSGNAAIHQSSARLDASFGNAAYLAVYLLLNVFVAAWLALTEKRPWLKWSLLGFAFVQAVLIFFTETRGAMLGLIGALFLAAILTAVTAGKKAQRFAFGAIAVMVILAGGFYAARDSALVQENRIFSRIASISIADGQTRFTIWSMAYEGAIESPVVGWGQEGFNYVFNKYYKPSLYGQESWFDRAHNAFIDWLVAGGVPGFLLYIALYVSAVVLLWNSSQLSRPERILLTAALAGYAFHNLFVFDNLYSYIYFFALLALIDSQTSGPTSIDDYRELSSDEMQTYALPVVAIVLIGLVWSVNITNMQRAGSLITAISQQYGFEENMSAFEELTQDHGFGSQEIREQLVSFASRVVRAEGASDEQKTRAVALAVTKMSEHVEKYPQDARLRLQLGYAYRVAGDIPKAMEQVLVAAELSPNKPEMWIEAGGTAWNAGDMKAADEYFTRAYELNNSSELAKYAAAGAWANGDRARSNEILEKEFGTNVVDSDILMAAYYRTTNWQGLIDILTLRADKPGATANDWFTLASAYYTSGKRFSAVQTLNEAKKRFPDSAKDVAAVLKQLQEGSLQ